MGINMKLVGKLHSHNIWLEISYKTKFILSISKIQDLNLLKLKNLIKYAIDNDIEFSVKTNGWRDSHYSNLNFEKLNSKHVKNIFNILKAEGLTYKSEIELTIKELITNYIKIFSPKQIKEIIDVLKEILSEEEYSKIVGETLINYS